MIIKKKQSKIERKEQKPINFGRSKFLYFKIKKLEKKLTKNSGEVKIPQLKQSQKSNKFEFLRKCNCFN